MDTIDAAEALEYAMTGGTMGNQFMHFHVKL